MRQHLAAALMAGFVLWLMGRQLFIVTLTEENQPEFPAGPHRALWGDK